MTTRRAAGARALALALVVSLPSSPRVASAQSEVELRAARELFQEAYKDEQERRYTEALDKFQRVARVRESGSVRYRIASVLEALGRLREARDAFRALAGSGGSVYGKDHEIAASAEDRAAALDKRIPRLILKLPDGAPEGTRVSVDGAELRGAGPSWRVELDPGDHVVRATAPAARPFESSVKLGESGEVAFDVVLAPQGSDDASRPTPSGGSNDAPSKRGSPALGYVGLGLGALLTATGVVLLLVREGEIGTIKDACPGDTCPAAKRDEVEPALSRAELFGPLGVGLGVGGLVVAGASAVFLWKRDGGAAESARGASGWGLGTSRLAVAPGAGPGGALVRVGGRF